MLKRMLAILWIGAAAALAQAQAQDADQVNQKEAQPVYVAMQTNLGRFVLELDPSKAPATVANFMKYVRSGFYDGTIFHRVISHFMIQGGGYTEDYEEKLTRPAIKNESNNGLSNLRGTIAMARTNDPNSATAQFFVNVVDNERLDYHEQGGMPQWGYAAFGKVIDGMDVVDAIRNLPTGPDGPFRSDVPQTPVVIEKAEVIAAPDKMAPTEEPKQ